MKYLFFFFFVVTTSFSYSQPVDTRFADTAFIYRGFGVGGTTASLWFYSKAVDTIHNVTRIQLDETSLDTLNFLIAHVKSKRHFQQKVGPSFYANISSNGKKRRLAIVPDWAIIDLENRRQYAFRNTPYAEIYNRFVDKNYR